MFSFFRYCYTLVLYITLPLVFLRLLWRSLRVPAYRQRWLERLGIFNFEHKTKNCIWVHAVSVGEVVAAIPVINALQARYPELSITVTTTTPTGSQRVMQSLGKTVTHVYLPYDLPWALNNFIRRVTPKILLILETELWPNLINSCHGKNIPIIIVNARLSAKSFAGYFKIKFLVSKILQQVTKVAAQSEADAERFKQLGIDKNKLQVIGNLKFDVQIPVAQQQAGKNLKLSLNNRLVWVAASTHAGEEEQIILAYKQVKTKFANCLLILIPRHPERFNEVAKLLEKNQLTYIKRSSGLSCSLDTAVLLGDTMGEMNIFYAAADVAFVGGSLVNLGGHNVLEPAALGVPIITGIHMSNFQEITNKLLAGKAICIINNYQELADKIIDWFINDESRKYIGAQGQAVIAQNRGALDRVTAELATFLSPSPLVPQQLNLVASH